MHFYTTLVVSERTSERVRQRSTRAKQAVRSKQMSEWCEQMIKRTSEWPSSYVTIHILDHSKIESWSTRPFVHANEIPYTCKQTSEWPSTYVRVLDCSGQLCRSKLSHYIIFSVIIIFLYTQISVNELFSNDSNSSY